MPRLCPRKTSGFTLVEALISVVLLALTAMVVSGLFVSGLQLLDAQEDRAILDSHLRSRMEALISTEFDQLANGNEVVSVNGINHTISWTIANADLDGDSNAESTAKTLTVTVNGRSLVSVVVDHWGRVGKI